MGKTEDVVTEYLSQPEIFADLFNGHVFGGLQLIKPDMLKIVESKGRLFLENKEKTNTFEVIRKERDIVREVLVGGRRFRLVICGVEHQSNIDYSMPLRVLAMDTLEYLKQAKEIERKHRKQKDVSGREYLSMFAKDDFLIPTITIVFYTNRDKWDAAMSLAEMFPKDDYVEKMIPYMVNAPLNLVSIYDVQDTGKYHSSLRKIFELMPHTDNEKDLNQYLERHEKEYVGFDYVTTRMLSVLLDLELPFESERQWKESDYEVCNAIKEMRENSREEGKKLSLIDLICKKLRKGKDCNVIAEELEEDVEHIRHICSIAEEFAPDYDIEKIYEALQMEVV